MDLPATLALAALFLGLAVFAGWRGARPPNPAKGPRLIPWRFVMLLATAMALLMVVHLANLSGVRTGGGAQGPLAAANPVRPLG